MSARSVAGAAEEMRHAGDVEPETIIAVDIERGAVAAGPAGKREQACGIFLRFGRRGEKLRSDGAGVGEAHAGREAFAHGGGIERGEQEPAILAADQRKGPVNRKGLAVPLQLQPLDRQSGEPDGNHTRHHETPRSNFAPAPCPGSARA